VAQQVHQHVVKHQQQEDQAQMLNPFTQSQKNKLIHFEKGDRIIYEPNEMH